MRATTRILGIDPGSRFTGFGVVDTDGQSSRYVASGVIKAAHLPTAVERLELIFNRVMEVASEHQPAEMAVERVFVHRNPDSALKLGQARSAAICATFGLDIDVYEYAPKEIKQAIVGKGGAGKDQVQHMVKVLLCLTGDLQEDESDALGIALCHAHTRTLQQRYSEASA